MSRVSSLAVTRMIGINGSVGSALSSLQTSKPSRFGIITSSRIRSGRYWIAISSASWPSVAVTTS